jgi:hypothetical protein
MPVPEPHPQFIDRALAKATGAGEPERASVPWRRTLIGWPLWLGAALGAAVTAVIMLVLLRPAATDMQPQAQFVLALNESRNIDVIIDSERDLKDATIRIVASGGIALDGFDSDREIGWHADLERGNNLLSLPVIARAPGTGQLMAVVEHEGRTRRLTVALKVSETKKG